MVTRSTCPTCKDGRVGFRLNADGETLVLVCDECAYIWTSPQTVDETHAIDPLQPDFKRRFPGLSLVDSRWATTDEVLAYGWAPYIEAVTARPE